ncbi:MAG: deoxyribonuclease IV [Herpetosiphon sp.]
MSAMHIGAHISAAGGLHQVFARGAAVGCDVLQLFTKSERQWRARPITEDDLAAWHSAAAQSSVRATLVHDSYLINLASPRDDLWHKSSAAFGEELERCAILGIPYLVTHPGAHTGSGVEAGLSREAGALNALFEAGVGAPTTVLLETTAGQGTCLGRTWEELAALIDLLKYPERVGICVDTCHLYAAGYDLATPEGYAATFERALALLGPDRIRAFHLNDSKGTCGGHLDRHMAIGAGLLGVEPFRWLVNDPRFDQLPMVIETPKGDDDAEDRHNLALLRGLRVAKPSIQEAP